MLSEGERTFHIRSDLLKTFLARNFQIGKGPRTRVVRQICRQRTNGWYVSVLFCNLYDAAVLFTLGAVGLYMPVPDVLLPL